ncbi:hypothetical protein DVB69_10000 [Sporosarcina sp. BI001-red]|uniref:hypothetical protein n=1 Tax=Sporosarcina sp. BI001-red TaxID=2282866 RepID=UPI000E257FA1|nr:hypothetical protein [Sporosarcina sp. BI001-red]REB07177.1 hypothetical protein DVB69_10000 [Sporosarcina sp. BI001-red]
MNFKKKYSKMTIMLALGQGVLLGIAAVAIVGFILLKTDKPESAASPNVGVPANGPASGQTDGKKDEKKPDAAAAGAPIPMYAKQHGVFSSKASATSFISDENLAKAAAVHAGDQFYVWSALGLSEMDADPAGEDGAFRKQVTVSPLACDSGEGELLRSVLGASKISEIQDLVASRKQTAGEGKKDTFTSNIAAITAFTDDLNVIKMHVLAHYSETGECVKLDF